MIPDFISAIYLCVADKLGMMAPRRSWLVPLCLLVTMIIAISALLVATKNEPLLSPITAVQYQVEVEALKIRLSTAEANTLALAGTVNKLVVVINRIKTPPSLGNLASKGELELLRLEITTWQKRLDNAGVIHDRALSILTLELEKLKQAVEELEEAVTTHTDNTTIHLEGE